MNKFKIGQSAKLVLPQHFPAVINAKSFILIDEADECVLKHSLYYNDTKTKLKGLANITK